MTLPKIQFFWSFILQERIMRSKYEDSKINYFLKSFESYFKKHDKTILKKIEYYSGFKWKTKQINVWIFDGFHDSLPEPLLLNIYDNDKKFALFKLIQMLTYNILIQNSFFYSYEIKDEVSNAITYAITKNVIKNIFDSNTVKKLCKQAENEGYEKYIWDIVVSLEDKWDIENTNLAAYMKKSNIGAIL